MKILETKRLRFRHLLPGDFDDLFALYRDPETRRYFPEGTLSYEETKGELEWFLNGHPNHPELGLWATILKDNDQFIGRCGLLPWTLEQRTEVEVAYLLAKEYWGQGLGTEAARGIADYAVEQLHLSRLICLITPQATLNAGDPGSYVQFYRFRGAGHAAEAARRVSHDGNSVPTGDGIAMVSWAGRPHFFRQGRLIALFTEGGEDGSDASRSRDRLVLKALREVMGRQFAGDSSSPK